MEISPLNIYRPKNYRPRGELVGEVTSGQGNLLFPVCVLFLIWLTLASLAGFAFGQIVVSGKELCFFRAVCQQLGPCRMGCVLGLQP